MKLKDQFDLEERSPSESEYHPISTRPAFGGTCQEVGMKTDAPSEERTPVQEGYYLAYGDDNDNVV